MSSAAARVAQVRRLMADEALDAIVVRSTDRYLNEYVPEDESTRLWLSGFTGSMGDVVIGRDQAWACVDGRYWLQAERELDLELFTVDRVPLGQRLFDNMFLLLAAGLLIMLLLYTGWGLWEITSLPTGRLP